MLYEDIETTTSSNFSNKTNNIQIETVSNNETNDELSFTKNINSINKYFSKEENNDGNINEDVLEVYNDNSNINDDCRNL